MRDHHPLLPLEPEGIIASPSASGETNTKFDGRDITGTMVRCTAVKDLITKCGKTPIYETTFHTTSISDDLIEGCSSSTCQ